MSALAAPEWLKPGAQVVLWTNGVNPAGSVTVTRVAKVAPKSFTVEAEGEPRFPIETMRKRIEVGGYPGTAMRHVMSTADPVGRYWLAVLRQSRASHTANAALTAWQAKPTVEDAHSARLALAEWIKRTEHLEVLKQEAGKR